MGGLGALGKQDFCHAKKWWQLLIFQPSALPCKAPERKIFG